MALASTLYYAALCLFAGAILHSELLDRSSSNDALSDGCEGDIPFISADDLKLFHASQFKGGSANDHA